MDMLEEQERKERDPDLEVDKDIIISDYRQKLWKNFLKNNHEDKGKVHTLR